MGDLPDAAEQLAVSAVVAGAESRGTLDDLEDELFRFGRIVSAQPELQMTLSSPFIAAERKQALLEALLGSKVTAASRDLITRAACTRADVAWRPRSGRVCRDRGRGAGNG